MRVVVLGGGYAGLVVARTLERTLPRSADLRVVDETGRHLVQHELHRVVRRPGLADAISIPLTAVLDRAAVHATRVDRLDVENRTVELADGATLSYDAAAVCIGATTNLEGVPGLREHATPLKRLDHATVIRERFEALLASGGGTAVVGGAGLSGIQVAGELAALAAEEGDDDGVRVRLLEMESTVAPSFPRNFQDAVRRALLDAGVDVLTGAVVEGVSAERLRLADGSGMPYDQLVWTGGIRGSRVMDGERPVVRSTLALDDRTFLVGDAARVIDADGEMVPASAQSAVAEARVAARNVTRVVEHDRRDDAFEPRLERFSFDSPGWVVSVGDRTVAQVGPSVFTGRAAATLKASAGVRYLAQSGAIGDALDLVREEVGPA